MLEEEEDGKGEKYKKKWTKINYLLCLWIYYFVNFAEFFFLWIILINRFCTATHCTALVNRISMTPMNVELNDCKNNFNDEIWILIKFPSLIIMGPNWTIH